MQVAFETSLMELLEPDGIALLGLTCLSCLLGLDFVHQSHQQALSDLVRSMLLLDPHPAVSRHRLHADGGVLQAAVYFFTVASAGMMSLDDALQYIDQYPALCLHGFAEILQSSLHALKPHVAAATLMVQRLSHLSLIDVLCHVWPQYLEGLASDHQPSTVVRSWAAGIGWVHVRFDKSEQPDWMAGWMRCSRSRAHDIGADLSCAGRPGPPKKSC